MPSLTRRTALRSGGAILAGGLTGCTEFDQESSRTPRLGELVVVNYDSRSHMVHVLLLVDGDPVYWASKEATPREDGMLGGAVFEGYPTEPGNYVLHVRIDNQRRSEWARFDFGEYDVSCLGIQIAIGDLNGTHPGDVSIWKTTNPHECREERAASRGNSTNR
jgi:hypothetical protein